MSSSAEARNKKILVVDDETEVLEFLKFYLDSLDWVTVTADTVAEAFRLLEHDEFFLIITDIAMPDMDGYEFINALREKGVASQMVLMTGFGYNPDHTLVKINRTSRYPVLFKPFNRKKVVKTIEAAWENYHQEADEQ
jgi:DNA-binding NtrC family response regulator